MINWFLLPLPLLNANSGVALSRTTEGSEVEPSSPSPSLLSSSKSLEFLTIWTLASLAKYTLAIPRATSLVITNLLSPEKTILAPYATTPRTEYVPAALGSSSTLSILNVNNGPLPA